MTDEVEMYETKR